METSSPALMCPGSLSDYSQSTIAQPGNGISRSSLTRSHTIHQDLSEDPSLRDHLSASPSPADLSEASPDQSHEPPPDPPQVNGDTREALDKEEEDLLHRTNGSPETETALKEMDDL